MCDTDIAEWEDNGFGMNTNQAWITILINIVRYNNPTCKRKVRRPKKTVQSLEERHIIINCF